MAYMLNCKAVNSGDICGQYSVDPIKLKAVTDNVIEGTVLDCTTSDGIQGILVKAFEKNATTGALTGITHTYSGCGGHYMLTIPYTISIANVVIMAASSSCPLPEPCEPCCTLVTE